MDVRERFERAQLVREMYPEFVDFCRDAAVVQEFLRNPMGTGPGVGRPLKSGHRVMRKRFGR